jgi:tRNA(Ile)-lysidine synthase
MLTGALAADELFAPLAEEPALLLAVSGGPDSVALMLLAAKWSRRPKAEKIAVATVDHGLRPESLEEALRVGEWAKALGFRHHLLRWEGPKPATRLQERAREARYALLCGCAREIDPECAMVTAHHADDQAETILFRLTRGSGVAGLAGMAPTSIRNGVRLLRPLLNIAKSEREDVCASAGQAFVRDPTNENEAFARARLRALNATLAAQGLDAHSLLRLGRRAAQAEEALSWCALRMRETVGAVVDEAETRLESDALRDIPKEILQRLLTMELHRRGGAIPRLDRLERAAQTISESLASGAGARITLGAFSIKIDNRTVTLTPAPPRVRGRAQSRLISPQGEEII